MFKKNWKEICRKECVIFLLLFNVICIWFKKLIVKERNFVNVLWLMDILCKFGFRLEVIVLVNGKKMCKLIIFLCFYFILRYKGYRKWVLVLGM